MHRFLEAPVVAMAALLCLWAGATQAQTTYSYTGQPFVAADPPYSTADRVVGSFETAEPLDPWLIDADISDRVTDFSYSDGQQTRTSTDSAVCAFRVTTDATGAIVDWQVDLRQAGLPPPPLPLPFIQSSRGFDEAGIGFTGDAPCGDLIPSETGRVERGGGQWNGGGDVTATPVLYAYDGAPYTVLNTTRLGDGDSLDLTFRLAGPLPPLLDDVEIGSLVELVELDDGTGPFFDPSLLQICRLQVSTDRQGVPVLWEGFVDLAVLPPIGPPYVSWRFSDQGDRVVRGFGQCSESISSIEASNQVPGRWYGAAARPVPATGPFALFVLGALLLIVARTSGFRT